MPTMQLRNIPEKTRDAIVQAARARGWTVAEYVGRLYSLHQAMIDTYHSEGTDAILWSLGLQKVVR